MRIFGFEVSRAKAAPPVLSSPGRGWNRVLEPYPGAWQANVTIDRQDVQSFAPVFACTTLIASDIGKLRPRLLRQVGAIWQEASDPILSPLLRRPNQFQTWQGFQTDWIMSLMRAGNCYAFIDRNVRGLPESLTVLNPDSVQPLITPRGDVYYKLKADNLAGLTADLLVPANEIIHHRINCLYHPLVGLPPLYAAGLAAQSGTNIARHTTAFFGAMARPSGILTAPGTISNESAEFLKEQFDAFKAAGAGAVAVVGDGLKFEQLGISSVDAQLIEVLKLNAVQVAQAFRVPPFMIGAETAPAMTSANVLLDLYYKSCLQSLIEGVESALDAGLNLADNIAIELDVEGGLLRLDTAARFTSYEVAMRSGWISPNEVRAKENLPPVEGGDTPYLQQQNFSLAALSKRDQNPAPSLPAPAPSKDLTPQVRHRGSWDLDRIYQKGDVVMHEGKMWRAAWDRVYVYEPGESVPRASGCWEVVG